MEKTSAFAPATIANVSVGFDTLGLALKSIGDTVFVSYNHLNENRILKIENGENLPKDISENCCGIVIAEMQKQLNDFRGVDIEIIKGYTSGSGLGSSSASSAAAALAFNQLSNSKFSHEDLVNFAAAGETVSGGEAHFDNVAPAIFGGLVLIDAKQKVRKLPLPNGLCVVVCLQDEEIKTIEARKVIPKEIPIHIARQQWASLGLFVSALYENDFVKLKSSMQDFIAKPYRKNLIPNFDELENIAIQSGAINFDISGSGPAVFSFVENESKAKLISDKWSEFLNKKEQKATVFYEIF